MTIPPKTPNPFMPSSYQLLSTYNPGTCVVATEPISGVSEMYLCIHNDASLSSNRLAAKPAPAAPPDSGYWMPIGGYSNGTPITDSATPILLDAWGNPIICIVGGKLSNVTAGGQKGTIVYSPDNRPFFASAGPDEDFTNGDDNMYSFEKP